MQMCDTSRALLRPTQVRFDGRPRHDADSASAVRVADVDTHVVGSPRGAPQRPHGIHGHKAAGDRHVLRTQFGIAVEGAARGGPDGPGETNVDVARAEAQ